jgi:DUF1680 family protein
MKKISLFLLITIIALNIHGQKITIDRNWKFSTNDSSKYALNNYQDSNWGNLKSTLWWGQSGVKHTGYAWYRKKVFIPKSLKNETLKLGHLKLNLGQITDADETFFNGELIGRTGSNVKFWGKWEENRAYFIKPELVKWGEDNLFAVRVFVAGDNGGMHTGPYTLEAHKIGIYDHVNVFSSFNQENIGQEIGISFKNSSPETFKGILNVSVYNEKNELIDFQKMEMEIPKTDSLYPKQSFKFNFSKEGIYKIKTVFLNNANPDSIQSELIINNIKSVNLPVAQKKKPIIENIVKDLFISSDLENVKIEGVLGKRLALNLEKRLLNIDEKGILEGYLSRPGRQQWIGEHVGKYLETACNTWEYTHNQALKSQMDRIVAKLLSTQTKNGYLGTYIEENYWTSWDVWSHKYNLIGLLAYYKTTGYEPAKTAAIKIGDLICRTFGESENQLNIIASGTHEGMASTSILEPMIDLYRFTGDRKHLQFAQYIIKSYNQTDGPAIIKSLLDSRQVNKVANAKAYEMLSNLVGIIKMYKLTGEQTYLNAVNIAWNDIVQNRLYVTGTSSAGEVFKENNELPAEEGNHIGEGCVTTTWVQLNYQLYTLTGDLKYLEQLETSVYNQLLGAENPQNGCVSYYTPLMGKKPYSCGITCCLSSVPRGIAMIPKFIYGKTSESPTINFYESQKVSDLVLTENKKKVTIKIDITSQFPEKGSVNGVLTVSEKGTFSINFWVPSWGKNFTIKIGKEAYKGNSGEYLVIKRAWNKMENIAITFDISTSILDGGKSYPNSIAFKRGPQVLAFDESLNTGSFKSVDKEILSTKTPIVLTNEAIIQPSNWIGNQFYTLNTNTQKLVLTPFADASQAGSNIKVWLKAE